MSRTSLEELRRKHDAIASTVRFDKQVKEIYTLLGEVITYLEQTHALEQEHALQRQAARGPSVKTFEAHREP